jgi:hypothetical protein
MGNNNGQKRSNKITIPVNSQRLLNRALYAFLLLLISSCQQKTFDSETDYWAYLKAEENGYHYQKNIGAVSYTLTYRPTDILVKQELRDGFTQQTIDSLRNKYDDYMYFNLSLSANNQELLNSKVGNKNDFGAMVSQLAFGMGEKVHLISQKRDTVPIADYIYPRMYGMSNSTSMLLVYPKDKELLEQEYFHFKVEDLGFATGEISFKVASSPIKHQPQLKFDQIL